MMICAKGDLCRNGDDAIQAEFLKAFFKVHDGIFKTKLHRLYRNALDETRKNGGSKYGIARL